MKEMNSKSDLNRLLNEKQLKHDLELERVAEINNNNVTRIKHLEEMNTARARKEEDNECLQQKIATMEQANLLRDHKIATLESMNTARKEGHEFLQQDLIQQKKNQLEFKYTKYENARTGAKADDESQTRHEDVPKSTAVAENNDDVTGSRHGGLPPKAGAGAEATGVTSTNGKFFFPSFLL
jgi:hypothetical protein